MSAPSVASLFEEGVDSRLNAIRRTCPGIVCQRPVLQGIEHLSSRSPYFNTRIHDMDPEDSGYFSIWDDCRDRHIYICNKKVGRSNCFNIEMNIEMFLDLVATQDSDTGIMLPGEFKKNYYFIQRAIIDIADTPGNVSIFCDNGRSRSPSLLAAYLVACYVWVHC